MVHTINHNPATYWLKMNNATLGGILGHSSEHLNHFEHRDISLYKNNNSYHHNDTEVTNNEYPYHGITIERPIYLYVWPFLVAVVACANILLIITLLRTLRNSISVLLIGIAVAETLALVVTLPSYVVAYSNNRGNEYVMTEAWCNAFMISKFFLSKWFRTVAIWLHCYLGFQRVIAIWRPFRRLTFLRLRTTILWVILIYACAFMPHVTRIINKHAKDGLCGWKLNELCEGGCSNDWIVLVLADLVPFILLCIFTTLIVRKIVETTRLLKRIDKCNELSLRGRRNTMRRSVTVASILVTVLIPEIPYILFIFYSTTSETDFEMNRKHHIAFEVLTALSYTANLLIVSLLNVNARRVLFLLIRTVICLGGRTHACRSYRRKSDETTRTGTTDIALPRGKTSYEKT